VASGKLVGRGTVAATVTEGQPGRLGLLTDENTKELFLVDTGSVYSIIPHSSNKPTCGPAIMAADKTPIQCWGWQQRVIRAGGQNFLWTFLLADVGFPILGADFLDHFDMLVDLRRRRLWVRHGQGLKLTSPPVGHCYAAIGVMPVPGPLPTVEALPGSSDGHLRPEQDRPPAAASQQVGVMATVSVAAEVEQLMADYPGVINNGKKLPKVRHRVEHVIETTCNRPIKARYRRLDPDKLEAAKAEF